MARSRCCFVSRTASCASRGWRRQELPLFMQHFLKPPPGPAWTAVVPADSALAVLLHANDPPATLDAHVGREPLVTVTHRLERRLPLPTRSRTCLRRTSHTSFAYGCCCFVCLAAPSPPCESGRWYVFWRGRRDSNPHSSGWRPDAGPLQLHPLGGDGWNRTTAWGFCRPPPFRLATPPW